MKEIQSIYAVVMGSDYTPTQVLATAPSNSWPTLESLKEYLTEIRGQLGPDSLVELTMVRAEIVPAEFVTIVSPKEE